MSEGLSKYLRADKDRDKVGKFSQGTGLGRYLPDTARRTEQADEDDTEK